MNCAIYCRLSKEDAEAGESESIQNQRNMLLRYAVERGWDVAAVYCDDDYSGADPHRPAWQAMLAAARRGEFQILLCKSLSRFTRDLEMLERYLHGFFPRWGIRFIALLDNVDTAVKGNKKARQISGLINEWYLEDLSENVRAVLDQKRREGKHIGNHAPYGFRKDPEARGRLLPCVETAAVVRRIYAWYLDGVGAGRIAARLNGEAVPSPGAVAGRGGLWSAAAVSRILRSPVYVGDMVQGTKRKRSYKSNKLDLVPKERWIAVEGTHEAIVSREVFQAVAARLSLRGRTGSAGPSHPLARRVRCGRCGGGMQRIAHRYGDHCNAYLQCALYAKTRSSPRCEGRAVRLDALTEEVLERVRAHLDACVPLSRQVLEAARQKPGGEGEQLLRELGALRREERRRTEALSGLYLDRAESHITLEEYQELRRSFQTDREALASRVRFLEGELRRLESADDPDREERELERLLRPEALSAPLVDALIDKVVVEQGDEQVKLHIHWAF